MKLANETKLDKLLKYLEVLSGLYFEGDPLNVKKSIERVAFLIEMEFNESFDEGGERIE